MGICTSTSANSTKCIHCVSLGRKDQQNGGLIRDSFDGEPKLDPVTADLVKKTTFPLKKTQKKNGAVYWILKKMRRRRKEKLQEITDSAKGSQLSTKHQEKDATTFPAVNFEIKDSDDDIITANVRECLRNRAVERGLSFPDSNHLSRTAATSQDTNNNLCKHSGCGDVVTLDLLDDAEKEEKSALCLKTTERLIARRDGHVIHIDKMLTTLWARDRGDGFVDRNSYGVADDIVDNPRIICFQKQSLCVRYQQPPTLRQPEKQQNQETSYQVELSDREDDVITSIVRQCLRNRAVIKGIPSALCNHSNQNTSGTDHLQNESAYDNLRNPQIKYESGSQPKTVSYPLYPFCRLVRASNRDEVFV